MTAIIELRNLPSSTVFKCLKPLDKYKTPYSVYISTGNNLSVKEIIEMIKLSKVKGILFISIQDFGFICYSK